MQNTSKLIIILALVCFGLESRAQSFDAGLFLGMTTSQVDGDGLEGFNLPGVNAGFYTKRPVGKRGYAKLELAFVQKGARNPPNDSNFTNFYKLRLNYIEIPLVYEYHWKDLFFELGVGVDLLITQKEEDDIGPRESVLEYHRASMMFLFGVTYQFNQRWALSVRTNNSISTISNGRMNVVSNNTSRFGPYGQRTDALSFALILKLGED